MRLVIDLQACETDSRDRGIGRYAMALTRAIASELDATDELVIAGDMADARRMRDLRNSLRRARIRARVIAYGYPATLHTDASPAARQLAGQLRSRFFRSLCPDVLLISSFMETGSCYTTELDWNVLTGIPLAVIGYDLIPLVFPQQYLQDGHWISQWYPEHVKDYKMFDHILTISHVTKADFVNLLHIDDKRLSVIGAGFDDVLSLSNVGALSPSSFSRLGITNPFILSVSNGDWRKNTVGTLDAFSRLPESLRHSHQLVLTQVGQYVREALADKYSHLRDRVKVLGRVDDATLSLLYRECEVFYFPSFYEGFGLPVLEAMAFNAAVLSSNAGALPEVIHDPRALFDPSRPGEGAALLARALRDARFRQELRTGAHEHALQFTWKRVARKALQSLRRLVSRSSGEPARSTAAGGAMVWPADNDIARMAEACISAGAHGERALEDGLRAAVRGRKRRVLVDITEIVRLDAKTGIQRVTRNFFAGLFAIARETGGFCVEPFRWTERGIYYAREYARTHLGVSCGGVDELVQSEPSDLIFMLDSSWWLPERFDQFHERAHAAGGEVVWMVYDLIPVRFPGTCNPNVLPAFSAWLKHAVGTADGFTCISEATRHDLDVFMDELGDFGRTRPWTRTTYLGSDLDPLVRADPTEHAIGLRNSLNRQSYFIGFGTLEPRKDYGTVLDAFERSWSSGADMALVIIGKQGWNVDGLVKRITTHHEYGQRLFWLQSANDADVRYLLEGASALIQASISEGFGLPLVEAGSIGVPLIASDIPVFREIAGRNARYFPVGDAASLSNLIGATPAAGNKRRPPSLEADTWEGASRKLVGVLLDDLGVPLRDVSQCDGGTRARVSDVEGSGDMAVIAERRRVGVEGNADAG